MSTHKELIAAYKSAHPHNREWPKARLTELNSDFLRAFLPWRLVAKLQQQGAVPLTPKKAHLIDAYLNRYSQTEINHLWNEDGELEVFKDYEIHYTLDRIIARHIRCNTWMTFDIKTQRILEEVDAIGKVFCHIWEKVGEHKKHHIVASGQKNITYTFDEHDRLIFGINLVDDFKVSYNGFSKMPKYEAYAKEGIREYFYELGKIEPVRAEFTPVNGEPEEDEWAIV